VVEFLTPALGQCLWAAKKHSQAQGGKDVADSDAFTGNRHYLDQAHGILGMNTTVSPQALPFLF
jgi:hypothetical protein